MYNLKILLINNGVSIKNEEYKNYNEVVMQINKYLRKYLFKVDGICFVCKKYDKYYYKTVLDESFGKRISRYR